MGNAGAARPRDETDDCEALRMIACCCGETRVVAELADRIFVPTEGERFSDRAVRPEPLDLNDMASKSLPGRKVPLGQLPSLSDP